MVPHSSTMMAATQRSPGGQTLYAVSTASQHVPQHTSPAPTLTSPARTSEQLFTSSSSPLDSQHDITSRDEMTSRQSLTSQLLAPSPQQQFSDQPNDQFMSMQSELHSYF